MESPLIEILSVFAGAFAILFFPLIYIIAPDWTINGYRFLVGIVISLCLLALFSFLLVWWLVWIGMLLPIGVICLLCRKDGIQTTTEEW